MYSGLMRLSSTVMVLSSPCHPHEPSRRGRDGLRPAKAPLPGAPNVVVLQTTAGWRKAPALALRVCTRGLASPSSISLKNTMNTAGLEWFGPPERNTLRPLVLYCLPSRESSRELVCAREAFPPVSPCSSGRALPFICPRGARTLSGAPTCGPGDVL